jgi:SNF2 family DNA or RNA helicase
LNEFLGQCAGERFTLVGIINYDVIFRRPELTHINIDTLMLDESSLIQNESTKRSSFILKMLSFNNVILLSGTPTNGKYENLWSQIHLLGWNISKDLYWKQYIDTEWQDYNGFPQRIVVGYKNVERLKAKLREHGAQFLKTEEVLNLPEQVEQIIKIPTIKEYRKFKKDLVVEIEGETLVGDNTLTQILYERQLCGHLNKLKLQAFEDLVQSTSDRLVVFYNFKAEASALINIANENGRPWSIICGDQKNLTAYENYDDSITLVQYQAGAMGLNLQKANKIIYFTLPLLSEHFEQSKKRIHRIGQTNTCFYYLMICKGSIEEEILQTLEMRKDYTDYLFQENYE